MQNYRNSNMTYTNNRQPIERVIKKDTLSDMPIAMAYVPWQKWQNIYDAEKGFYNGTIFQDLNLPFYGTGGVLR